MRACDLRDSIIEQLDGRVPAEIVAGRLPELFMKTQLQLVEDQWAGQPLEITPRIRDNFLRPLYGTLDESGRRLYTEGLIGMPRKWSKTTTIAASALFHLFMEPVVGQLIATVAHNDRQANKALGFGKMMVEANPLLLKMCGGKTYSDRIYIPELEATWRAFPHSASDIQGEGLRIAIFEEPHTYRSSRVIDAVRSGMGAREEPLVLGVTTAGPVRKGPLWDWIHGAVDPETGLREGGIKRDPRGFIYWLGADDEAAIDDRELWRELNAPWITMDYLEDMYRRLTRSEFERYHLNRFPRVGRQRPAIHPDVWMSKKNCRKPVFDPSRGTAVMAIDAADKKDRTAVIVAQQDDAGDVSLFCHVRRRDQDREYIDYLALEDDVRTWFDEYGVDRIGYDRRQLARSMQELEDERYPVEEFPQTNDRMCAACGTLLELAATGRLRHGGDPVLAEHINNAGEYPRPPMGWRFVKKDPYEPDCVIDAAVAAAMAVFMATATPESGGVWASAG